VPDAGISQKAPDEAGRSLPQGPRARKRGDGPNRHQKPPKSVGERRGRPRSGQFGSDLPSERRKQPPGADRDERIGGAGGWLRPSVHPVICVWDKTHSNGSTMTDDGGKADGTAGGLAKKASRQDRLKQALRENLKRRKSQARGRSDAAGASSNSDDGPPHHGGGKKPPNM